MSTSQPVLSRRGGLKQPAMLREAKAPPAGNSEAHQLAIPDYDALGAREVAARLARVEFSIPALKRIEEYEAEHKKRPSVLRAVRSVRSVFFHGRRLASF